MSAEATTQRVAIGRVAARLARHIDIVLAELELSPSQYRVLGILSLGPEGASRLASNLAISKPSLTGVVDGLVAHGLIGRKDDASDRRRVALALTPAGSRILQKADRALERRLESILAHADPEDAALAREGLAAWQTPLEADRIARGVRR